MVFVRSTIWHFPAPGNTEPTQRRALYEGARSFLTGDGYNIVADDVTYLNFRVVCDGRAPGLRFTTVVHALPDPTGGSNVRVDLRCEETGAFPSAGGAMTAPRSDPSDLLRRRAELRAQIHRVQDEGEREWEHLGTQLKAAMEAKAGTPAGPLGPRPPPPTGPSPPPAGSPTASPPEGPPTDQRSA